MTRPHRPKGDMSCWTSRAARDRRSLQLPCGLRSDARYLLHGQRCQKLPHRIRFHRGEPVWLLKVSGDLGYHLAGADARGGGDPLLPPDRLRDGAGALPRPFVARFRSQRRKCSRAGSAPPARNPRQRSARWDTDSRHPHTPYRGGAPSALRPPWQRSAVRTAGTRTRRFRCRIFRMATLYTPFYRLLTPRRGGICTRTPRGSGPAAPPAPSQSEHRRLFSGLRRARRADRDRSALSPPAGLQSREAGSLSRPGCGYGLPTSIRCTRSGGNHCRCSMPPVRAASAPRRDGAHLRDPRGT